jgi:hypothetical protein
MSNNGLSDLERTHSPLRVVDSIELEDQIKQIFETLNWKNLPAIKRKRLLELKVIIEALEFREELTPSSYERLMNAREEVLQLVGSNRRAIFPQSTNTPFEFWIECAEGDRLGRLKVSLGQVSDWINYLNAPEWVTDIYSAEQDSETVTIRFHSNEALYSNLMYAAKSFHNSSP